MYRIYFQTGEEQYNDDRRQHIKSYWSNLQLLESDTLKGLRRLIDEKTCAVLMSYSKAMEDDIEYGTFPIIRFVTPIFSVNDARDKEMSLLNIKIDIFYRNTRGSLLAEKTKEEEREQKSIDEATKLSRKALYLALKKEFGDNTE